MVSSDCLLSYIYLTKKISLSQAARASFLLNLLPPDSCHSLLLGRLVDVGTDNEGDQVEEWHPRMRRQELLGEQQRKWTSAPRHLHNWHEPNLDGRADLVECPCAGDDRHAREVHGVLDRRDQQITYDDLRNFRRSGGATGKKFLEQGHEYMPERRGNEGAIDSHLRDTGGQVGATLAAVASDYRGEDFLEGGKRTGSEHLSPPERDCCQYFMIVTVDMREMKLQWIFLELTKIDLEPHSSLALRVKSSHEWRVSTMEV